MVPRGGALAEALKQDPTTRPTLISAGWADGAKDRLMKIRYWARDIGIAEEQRGLIVNRAGDYTSKLATIRAISRRNLANPLVATLKI